MRFAKMFSKQEPGVAVSAFGHAAIVVAGLVAFGASPVPFKDADEAIAVEVVDPSALNEVTKGERSAPAVQDTPKPRAERQSEITEQKDPGEAKRDAPTPPTRPAELKTAERDEVAPPPPPPPRPAPVRQAAKPEPEAAKPEAKPDPKPREAAKPEPKPELRRDQLAALSEQAELQAQREKAAEDARAAAKARAESEAHARAQADAASKARAEAAAIAKAEAEAKAEAVAEAKEKAEADAKAKADAASKAKAAADARAKAAAEAKARRDAQLAAQFNPSDISKLLNSKEPAQSAGSTGREVNRVASLGTQTGNAQRMNPNMRSQLIGIIKEQLEKCWNVPVALQGSQKPPVPSVRVALKQDGTLASQPSVVNASSDPLFRVAADSALTATRRCTPLRIPAQFAPFYNDWRDVVVNFDARDVL